MPTFVADRGSVANVTAGASATVTLAAGASVAVGNSLIARVAVDNAGAAGAAPGLTVAGPASAVNPWKVHGVATTALGQNLGSSCYIVRSLTMTPYANGAVITFSFGVSVAAKSIVVEEWSDVDITDPGAAGGISGTGTFAATGVAVPQLTVGQVAYCALAIEGPNADAYTEDTDTVGGTWASLTRLGSTNATATNNQKIVGAYKRCTANGAGLQTWNATITARDWAGLGIILNSLRASTATTAPRDQWTTVATAATSGPVIVDNKAGTEHVYLKLPDGTTPKVVRGAARGFALTTGQVLQAMPCATVNVTVMI